jgi:glycosyltransferase involved in cell wall biosynthesis
LNGGRPGDTGSPWSAAALVEAEMAAEPMESPALSFVIPALNEAHNIPRTLASIRRHASDYSHEVIVVDNGSTDATVRLAEDAGAVVLMDPSATIGALRNLGARRAGGRVLVFLDADVSLATEWRESLPDALAAVQGQAPVVTGSHCGPPDDCGWIERNWFGQFAVEQDVSHLGTGHMMLDREFFLRIGGFDEGLETGEDYEFCQRARAAGAGVVNDPRLRVVHHDFPRSLRQFVRREAWHGRGDLRSLPAFLHSKVAIGAAVFLLAHLMAFGGLLVPRAYGLFPAGLTLLLLLLGASAWKKYHHAPWPARLVNAVLFYFYYLGRALSFLHLIRKRPARARRIA